MEASLGLESFIDESIRISQQHNYFPNTFIGMRAQHQTIPAISRLVISGEIQSGFRKLQSYGLLDWTIEAAVVKFPEEFSREVVAAAKWRLEQARRGD